MKQKKINVRQPTLIVDKERLIANISRMLAKTAKSNTILRPHFKTHQNISVGKVFSSLGIDKITVSSFSMSRQFRKAMWKDITVAFPLNISELSEIDGRNSQSRKVSILIEAPAVMRHVELAIPKWNLSEVSFFIEIDTGYKRSGVYYSDIKMIDEILEIAKSNSKFAFKGFLTHSGHTYKAKSKDEIIAIWEDTVSKMTDLKNRYIEQYPQLIISLGDTPSCSIVESFEGVDEIRPGNFAYYDLMQEQLGSCVFDDIAVVVACSVVGLYPERNEVVIYGGAVHLSKEYLETGDGKIYGKVVELDYTGKWEKAIEGCYVKSMSQEHGVLHVPDQAMQLFDYGKIVGIVPVHSCLTANLHRKIKLRDKKNTS